MREYSDEHEHQKVSPASDTTAAAPSEVHWSAFKQFAAKLNVFA